MWNECENSDWKFRVTDTEQANNEPLAYWEKVLLGQVTAVELIVTFQDGTVHTFDEIDYDSIVWVDGRKYLDKEVFVLMLTFEEKGGELIHYVPNVKFYTTRAKD